MEAGAREGVHGFKEVGCSMFEMAVIWAQNQLMKNESSESIQERILWDPSG